MKNKALIFILLIAILSCKKGGNPNVVLNGALTNCPLNSTCTYNYYDNADFVNVNQPVPGSFRVFGYKSTNANVCGASSQLYFKTPVSDSEFDITTGQIVGGQVVAYNSVCLCCDYAVLAKPIGGEVKGKRTDATHWLVNASIVFGVSNTPIDTLVVNQVFTAEKLP